MLLPLLPLLLIVMLVLLPKSDPKQEQVQ